MMPTLKQRSIARLGAILGVVAACGGAGFAGDTPETIDLSPKFSKGESTTYEHTMQLEQRKTVQFAANDLLTAEVNRRFTVRVAETFEDGGARIAITFDRVALRVQPPREEAFEFDSALTDEENPAGPRSAVLRAVADSEVSLLLDRAGGVRGIEGFESVAAVMRANRRARDMETMLGEQWFRGLAAEIWGVAGEKSSRAIGEEWEKPSATRPGGLNAGETTVRCTLAEAGAKSATIRGDGRIEGVELAPVLPDVKPEVADQKMEFTMVWDRERGQLASYETMQTMSISQGGPGLEIMVHLSTAATMRRVDPS